VPSSDIRRSGGHGGSGASGDWGDSSSRGLARPAPNSYYGKSNRANPYSAYPTAPDPRSKAEVPRGGLSPVTAVQVESTRLNIRRRRVLDSAVGPLALPRFQRSTTAHEQAEDWFDPPGDDFDTIYILEPTPPGPPVPWEPRQAVGVPIAIEDVASFSRKALNQGTIEVKVIASGYSANLDGFYGEGMPFPASPVKKSGITGEMLHPLQGRLKSPYPNVRRIGVPDSW
jgi:hypothetical protein